MDCNLHAAFWSDSPSHLENRYRITHHKRTKQRVNRQEPQEATEAAGAAAAAAVGEAALPGEMDMGGRTGR